MSGCDPLVALKLPHAAQAQALTPALTPASLEGL